MKKAPYTFQAHGARERSAIKPKALSRTYRIAATPLKQLVKRSIVGMAIWGILPVKAAECLIRRFHLEAA